MKRAGNLFPQVTAFENLMISFKLALKGCGKTKPTCRFFYHLESEILRLQQELIKGTYQPGAYRYFTVYDPKKRTIAVAPFRDRVVHHAIVRILIPIYERTFIYDSYATRTNKGTHVALKRAQKFMRRRPWYFKADIEKYFDSVDHDILMGIIKRKIKDRDLLRLLDRIIRNTAIPGKGIPIGNLTSQFLANVYLDPFDHYLKDHLGVKGYLRYMDDFVLFADTKKELLKLCEPIEVFLSDHLALFLKEKSTFLQRSGHGLSFLGMRIFPGIIRVKAENRRRSLKRIEKKIADWEGDALHEDRIVQSVVSIIGHLRYFCPHMQMPLGIGT